MSELNNSSLLVEDDSIQRNSCKEDYFLGNKVEEKHSSYIGKIKILMYSSDIPVCSIGPDCKFINSLIYRSFNDFSYTSILNNSNNSICVCLFKTTYCI